jgi:hypothetical protein
MTPRARALLRAVVASVEDAYAEAVKDRNIGLISHLEEALETLKIIPSCMGDEDPEELDFE